MSIVEVNLDHVGLILNLEMSRLARSNKDWHHLIEVCGIFRTLLGDHEGLYDPQDTNDRLVLGMKAMFSEVELRTLHNRLHQGRLHKAQRGELVSNVPIGYVKLLSGEVALDPDTQVQTVVRLIFDKFAELGSASAVLAYLTHQDIRIGVRLASGPNRGDLDWRRPRMSTLLNLLHHPGYAGAYAYGRRAFDPRRRAPGQPRSGRVVLPMDQWQVLHQDIWPAYIPWEQYLSNQQQLEQNRARIASLGAAREGAALLPGLLYCGMCGRRLVVSYNDQTYFRYSCCQKALECAEPRCQSLPGRVVDELVGAQVLRALQPASLELSLHASAQLQQERNRLCEHWQQRLQRTQYDVERAFRQSIAVEPENRLVARERECRWEQALREFQQLQEEYDRFLEQQPRQVTESERQTIRALSQSVPALWHASTTSVADRQTIIRYLVERVVVQCQGTSELVDVTITWAGGYLSEHQIRRPVGTSDRLRDFDQITQRIVQWRGQGHTAARIADRLNAEGFRPAKGRCGFTAVMVRQLQRRYCPEAKHLWQQVHEQALGTNEWWASDLCQQLHLNPATLHLWGKRGWLHARQLSDRFSKWIYWADADELVRLSQLRDCTRKPYPRELTTPKPRN